MIRFCDKEIVCVMQDELERGELLSYFLRGHRTDSVIVLDEKGEYVGRITYPLLLNHEKVEQAIDKNYVVMDDQIFINGRQFFKKYTSSFGERPILPVLTKEKQLLCFAYEEEESNREIRMLRELEATEGTLGFEYLYPKYDCVTINGCNELAYYFAMYLRKRAIPVNVTGDLWSQLGEWENYPTLEYRNYQVYAEGTKQLEEDLRYRQIHSISPEFECIDVIYEENLNRGIIQDTKGDWNTLLNTLRNEKEIVILGTGLESQDAYDLLVANGVDCCCFTTKVIGINHKMFHKEIVTQKEAMNRFRDPVFIECTSKHSTWGLDGVDDYDYYGFERNERFFVIQDYVDVPKTSLKHALEGKQFALVGDIYLCNHLYRYFQGKGDYQFGYLNLWEEDEVQGLEIPKWNREDLKDDCQGIVVIPQYIGKVSTINKHRSEIESYHQKLKEVGLKSYTDYFSYLEPFLFMETGEEKYTKSQLTPKAIMLGMIPAYSGNVFVRDVLEGHPNIVDIEYSYFNDNLCQYCIRLSEISPKEVFSTFEKMYEKEAGSNAIQRDFPKKDVFQKELEQMLLLKDKFTSQELFVMFYQAYAKMIGKEVKDIKATVIYFEPHFLKRSVVAKMAKWLNSSMIQGYTLRMTRNRVIAAGSLLRVWKIEEKTNLYSEKLLHFWETVRSDLDYEDEKEERWQNIKIKFEDLKCKPLETYREVCERLGVFWEENLLENVKVNKFGIYAKGFDLKPVYNNYEEYFTSYDRMKVSFMQSPYQKKFGYPYLEVSNFTRKELQDMFLKDFRFETKFVGDFDMDFKLKYQLDKQQMITKRLWRVRQLERMQSIEEATQ